MAKESKATNSKAATTPAKPKGRGGRPKKSEQAVIDLDKDDPFNFDAQGNNHPAPLQNFNVQKGNFGDLKFVRSSNAADVESRYANTEKAASRNLLSVAASTQNEASPSNHPTSIMEMTTTTPAARKAINSTATPKSAKPEAKKRGRKPKEASVDAAGDAFDLPASETQSAKRPPKTPRRGKRESPALFTPKPKAEIKAPELSAEEQLEVDFAEDPLPNGTRVFALWGNEYYPAIICDIDGLGRYKVIFTEDSESKDVPPPGIIPLSTLHVGHQVAITGQKDEVDMILPVKILRIPSKENAQEWNDGEFQIQEVDDDNNEKEGAEAVTRNWKTLMVTKFQQKDIVSGKNVHISVDKHNIVPRSARRSRLAASTITVTPQTTKRKSTVAASTSRKTPAAAASTTRKTAAAKSQVNGDTPAVASASRTPKKRGRKPKQASDQKSVSPSPKRSRASELVTEPAEPQEQKEPNENGHTAVVAEDIHMEEVVDDRPAQIDNLFEGRYFMLTSSTRRSSSVAQFNKREYKTLIEERGGIVAEEVDELQNLPEEAEAYLIADTYYRTHKYLFALAASIPCVNFKWINECVDRSTLVDYTEFLLPAGASAIDGKEHPWKKLKGELFKGKTIFVHSVPIDQPEGTVRFAEIWRPLLNLLGAKVITTDATEVDEILEYCKSNEFDVMLTDRTCYTEIVEYTTDKSIPSVSSNWIIHAIVTGEFADVSLDPSFSPQAQ